MWVTPRGIRGWAHGGALKFWVPIGKWFFLVGEALDRDASPAGGRCLSAVVLPPRAYARQWPLNPAQLLIVTLAGDGSAAGRLVGLVGGSHLGLLRAFDVVRDRVVDHRVVTFRDSAGAGTDPPGTRDSSAQTVLRGAGPGVTPQRSANASTRSRPRPEPMPASAAPSREAGHPRCPSPRCGGCRRRRTT